MTGKDGTMRKKMLATVHVLLDTDDFDEALMIVCDMFNFNMPDDNGNYRDGNGPGVLNFAYSLKPNGKSSFPRLITVPPIPDPYELDDWIAQSEFRRYRRKARKLRKKKGKRCERP